MKKNIENDVVQSLINPLMARDTELFGALLENMHLFISLMF